MCGINAELALAANTKAALPLENLDLESECGTHGVGHFQANLGIHLLGGAFGSSCDFSSVLCPGSGGSLSIQIIEGDSLSLRKRNRNTILRACTLNREAGGEGRGWGAFAQHTVAMWVRESAWVNA